MVKEFDNDNLNRTMFLNKTDYKVTKINTIEMLAATSLTAIAMLKAKSRKLLLSRLCIFHLLRSSLT